jgi:hypothetical protein
MSDQVSIEWPRMEVDRLFAQMQRAQKELGKGLKQSVRWGGVLLMQSLAAGTNVSKKLRPIVRNPDTRYKTDKRFAPFGVFRWDRSGKKYFKPIYRTGEYGRIRFIDKKTAEVKYISSLTGKVHRAEQFDQTPGQSIKTDKRRIIGRRGLAKKTWQWAVKSMNGGMANIMQVPDIASIRWSGGTDNPTVTINNRIRYMGKALKGGYMALNNAIGNAARKMANRIDDQIAKKLGAK